MRRPRILSAAFVRTVTRPGRYGDGRGGYGLSLLVKPMANGRLSKTWSQRVRFHGRVTNIGLGAYPIVSLAEARKKAVANRRTIEAGLDPRGSRVPSFSQATEKVIAIHAAGWKPGGKSEAQWRASLTTYAYPRLGRRGVDRITTADVMACLVPIWHTRPETARRVRQRIGAVMRWAIAQGYRTDNPAGDAIAAALPSNMGRRRHHRALPHADVAASVARVRASGAYPTTVLAFEFLVLTACRSGEVRGAQWDEINLDEATDPTGFPDEDRTAASGTAGGPGCGSVGRRRPVPGPQRAGVPLAHRAGTIRRDPFQTAAGTRHPRSAPRIPIKLPGLGSRTDRHTPPDL